MRLNIIYFKSRHHAKAPQNEKKVPFKEIIPLSLKNSVKGSSKNVIGKMMYFTIQYFITIQIFYKKKYYNN